MTPALTAALLAVLLLPPLIAALLVHRRRQVDGPGQGRRVIGLAAKALWISVAASLAIIVVSIFSPTALSLGAVQLEGAALVVLPLVALVAAVVTQFSVRYMAADPRPHSFAARLLLLVTAVMMVAVSADAILFTLAWVLTGLLLAQLVGHARGWPAAEAAQRRLQRSFAVGDGLLVLGVLVLILATGSTRIAAIAEAAPTQPAWLIGAALTGILIGGLARSAVLPFHGWLITSMTAPTPVSALMHAGLVNAGGVAVALWAPVLVHAPYLFHGLFALGAATALIGSASMLVRPDIKRVLGASTVSQMGFMIMQCGLGAIAQALYHMVAHGLFKASLFLGAGSNVGSHKAQAAARPVMAAGVAVGALVLVALASRALTGAWPDAASPSTLLGVFAVLAAAQAAAALPATGSRLADAARLSLAVIVCAGLYGAGVGLAALALGPTAIIAEVAIGPVHWAVIAAFAALWLAQAVLAARGRALPPALHARLLNVGRPRNASAAELFATGRHSAPTA